MPAKTSDQARRANTPHGQYTTTDPRCCFQFFADIHRNNELNSFVLPVTVTPEFLAELFASINENPLTEIIVDLPAQTITNTATGHSQNFDINPYKKECLLNGLDDIDYLLTKQAEVEAWEASRQA